MFSVGGGTGSGLGSYTLQLLADEFPDVDRSDLALCKFSYIIKQIIIFP